MPRETGWRVGVLLALCGIFFFYDLGGVGLFDVDEAVYAEVTREMWLTGDWLTPRYNQENRFDKPILIYWLMGLGFAFLGPGEWGARVVSATAATLLVVGLYGWLRRQPWSGTAGRTPPWYRDPALTSSLVLATSLEVFLLGRAALTDMTLTLWMTLTLLAAFQALQSPHPRTARWAWRVAAGAAGLAVLTKGLVGIVLPGLILGAWLTLTRRWQQALREIPWGSALALFVLITFPWYGAMLWLHGWEFVELFFIKHHFVRYTGVVSGHSGPFYYFFLVILLGFFPWSVFLIPALWQVIRRWMQPEALLPPGEEAIRFALVWFGVILGFFSLSGTKLPGYVLPLYPAMALLVGVVWCREGGWMARRGPWVGVGLLGVILAGTCLAGPWILEQTSLPPEVNPEGVPWVARGLGVLGGVLILGLGVALGAAWRGSPGWALGALVGGMILVAVTLVEGILPGVDRALQQPLRSLAQEVGQRIQKEGGHLVIVGLNRPSILFYARQYAWIQGPDRPLPDLPGPLWVIALREETPRIPHLKVLRGAGGVVLARVPSGQEEARR